MVSTASTPTLANNFSSASFTPPLSKFLVQSMWHHYLKIPNFDCGNGWRESPFWRVKDINQPLDTTSHSLPWRLRVEKRRGNLQGMSPPKRNAKGRKNSETDCLICNEPILEPSKNCFGDEAVFCERSYQGWLHRRCAGLIRPAFDKIGNPDTQYFCSHCAFVNHNKEINNLANIIKELNSSILALTETVSSLQSHVTKHSHQVQQPSVSPPTASSQPTSPPMALPRLSSTSSDRKINVGVYGIAECPGNTTKQTRTLADLTTLIATLKEKEVTIESNSIKDLHHLGNTTLELLNPAHFQ